MAPGILSEEAERCLPSILQEPLCHVLTPIGMLGYSFGASLTQHALEDLATNFPNTPAALIIDSGSTDSGPAKLALGGMTCPRSAYERDMRQLMSLSHDFGVPIIISSAGGDGTDAHVDEFLDIIQEITNEPGNESYNFKTLAIYSNVSKTTILKSLDSGGITGCGLSVPPLTLADVNDAVTIVAQMGPEPFLAAMNAHPDFNIIIGGRAYDPSPYTAFCNFHAQRNQGNASLTDAQIGGYTHMGKIMECGAFCATPKSQSSMATIYLDGSFDIKSLDIGSLCTPASVAAHTLYEKSRPDVLAGPGGMLDLTTAQYKQLSDGVSVHVRGAMFKWLHDSNKPYTVKLEAARLRGFRTIVPGGIRDPILIAQIDDYLARVKEYVKAANKNVQGEWEIGFHLYGTNGIMGSLEPGDAGYQPREIFVVSEALAPTQSDANSVASSARIALTHGPYPGQRGTGGNLAMGVGGKLEIEMGACAEFCMYHLMSLPAGAEGAREITEEKKKFDEDPTGPLFSWRVRNFGKTGTSSTLNENGRIAQIKPRIQATRRAPKAPNTIVKATPPKLTLNSSSTLAEVAPVIRSKNSGPYEITLDVVFSSLPIYNTVKKFDLLNKTTIARLYHLDESQIIWCGFFDQAMAFKATLPRMRNGKSVSSGSYMESDVHGSQQYVALLDLRLGEEICKELLGLQVSALG